MGPAVQEVAAAIVALQIATEKVDAAAASRLSINRTDHAIVSLLDSRGPLWAREVASGAGLSAAATTTALQRLDAAGYVGRRRDPADGRRTIVELTAQAQREIRDIYGPLGAEGQEALHQYSSDQLRVIHAFLVRATELQERHAQRIGRHAQ